VSFDFHGIVCIVIGNEFPHKSCHINPLGLVVTSQIILELCIPRQHKYVFSWCWAIGSFTSVGGMTGGFCIVKSIYYIYIYIYIYSMHACIV